MRGCIWVNIKSILSCGSCKREEILYITEVGYIDSGFWDVDFGVDCDPSADVGVDVSESKNGGTPKKQFKNEENKGIEVGKIG